MIVEKTNYATDFLTNKYNNCFYIIHQSLELTSLSESIVRLDIAGAARDLQRANYVLKVGLDSSRHVKNYTNKP